MRPNLPLLTSLRFFAALAVILFHYDRKQQLFPHWLSGFGYDAVTFFFVLSGFVLTYVHGERSGRLNVDTHLFVVSRIARIVPAYALSLAIATPFFLRSIAVGSISPLAFAGGAILAPFLLQALVPATALVWNMSAWSLSDEMLFYAIYPKLYQISQRVNVCYLLAATVATVVAVSMWSRSYYGWSAAKDWHNFVAYWPLFHLPQFAFGIALGSLFIRERRWSVAYYNASLTAGIAAVAVIAFLKSDAPWLASSAFLAPAFGILILGAAGASGGLARLLSWRPLVTLGNASYAIYILHLPLWLWWDRATEIYAGMQFSPAVDFFSCLLVVTVLSVAVTAFVERPARKFIVRVYMRRRSTITFA